MKKLTVSVFVIILSITAFNLNAQDKDQYKKMQHNKEKIEAQKVAFITDRLDLSSAEAEKFWPVYNAYKNEQKTLQKTWRETHNFTQEDIEAMSDADAELFTSDQINHEQEMLNLRKGLITDMKGVISPKKIVMLLKAEKDFRVELMRKMSHGRGQGEGKSDSRR